MNKIERIKVFVSDEYGVLAFNENFTRVEIEPYGFRRFYQPIKGIITLGNSRIARVRGRKKDFCRQPEAGESLIAIIAIGGRRPQVLKWNFASVYDDLIAKCEREADKYELVGALAAGA